MTPGRRAANSRDSAALYFIQRRALRVAERRPRTTARPGHNPPPDSPAFAQRTSAAPAHSLVGHRPLAPGGAGRRRRRRRRRRQPEQRGGPAPRRANQSRIRARAPPTPGPGTNSPRLRHEAVPCLQRLPRPATAEDRRAEHAQSHALKRTRATVRRRLRPLPAAPGPATRSRPGDSVTPSAPDAAWSTKGRGAGSPRGPVSFPARCPERGRPLDLADPEGALVQLPRAAQTGRGPSFSLLMPSSCGLTSQFKGHRFFGASADLPSTTVTTSKQTESAALVSFGFSSTELLPHPSGPNPGDNNRHLSEREYMGEVSAVRKTMMGECWSSPD